MLTFALGVPLLQRGNLRRQRAGGLIQLFLRRFGSGGQFAILFVQRVERGFLLAFILGVLLLQRGNLRRQRAGGLIQRFLRHCGGSAQFKVLAHQRVYR